MRPMRLLGFAPVADSAALFRALATLPGPDMTMLQGQDVAVFIQAEPSQKLLQRGRKALLTGLHTVQRRLEVACQAGAFLPMDPASACCPAALIPRVLDSAWAGLAIALAAHGAGQQWDVILRWPAEPVVAAHRVELAAAAEAGGKPALAEAVAGVLARARAQLEAALLAALRPVAYALAPPAGTETEVAITALMPSGGEVAIEAALGALTWPGATAEALEALTADMRGPLPPVSFAAVRLVTVEQSIVARAWRTLNLPEQTDSATLHAHWRHQAAAAHPDHAPAGKTEAANAEVSALTDAYKTLRDLLPASSVDSENTPITRADVLQRAGYRLVLPHVPAPPPSLPLSRPALQELVS
jgi:hypothetical protein